MAKKKKKGKKNKKLINLKTKLIIAGTILGLFLVSFVMMFIISAITSIFDQHEYTNSTQESNLEEYANSTTKTQQNFVNLASQEYEAYKASGTRGGKKYQDKYGVSSKNNYHWNPYFVDYYMEQSGIEAEYQGKTSKDIALKCVNRNKFHLPDNYIPRQGDIVFFGTPYSPQTFEDIGIIRDCGIVTNVDLVINRDGEGIKVLGTRITVIAGDILGTRLINGNYDHSNSVVGQFYIDMYDVKRGIGTSVFRFDKDIHTSEEAYNDLVLGFATVSGDAKQYKTTTESWNYEDLYYDLQLQKPYGQALSEENEKNSKENR